MELAIGGTAVGTGINSPEGFGAAVSAKLAARFGLPFVEAENHFEAQGSQDAAVELANQLSTVATSLLKIANDVRWLSSGPRCGLGELSLPAVQPGSSIMPGKVNPVMCEQLIMVCAQVIGNAVTVTVANTHGNLDLNVMLPVMARNVLESLTFLANSVNVFTEKAIVGLTANKERAESLVEWSMSMVTSLAPVIGYDNAAKLAKRAVDEGRTVRDLCLSELPKTTSGTVLTAAEVEELLDARKMTEPGVGAGGNNETDTTQKKAPLAPHSGEADEHDEWAEVAQCLASLPVRCRLKFVDVPDKEFALSRFWHVTADWFDSGSLSVFTSILLNG